jgi:hypothetical protein
MHPGHPCGRRCGNGSSNSCGQPRESGGQSRGDCSSIAAEGESAGTITSSASASAGATKGSAGLPPQTASTSASFAQKKTRSCAARPLGHRLVSEDAPAAAKSAPAVAKAAPAGVPIGQCHRGRCRMSSVINTRQRQCSITIAQLPVLGRQNRRGG